jgi:hypothetical protein
MKDILADSNGVFASPLRCSVKRAPFISNILFWFLVGMNEK